MPILVPLTLTMIVPIHLTLSSTRRKIRSKKELLAAGHDTGRMNYVCCEAAQFNFRRSHLTYSNVAMARLEDFCLYLFELFMFAFYTITLVILVVNCLWILLGVFVYPERYLA